MAKAKPGQEVLKPKAVAELQANAEKLKHFEERFGAQKQVLAKWSRDLVTSHASAVTAIEALKALLLKLAPPSQ